MLATLKNGNVTVILRYCQEGGTYQGDIRNF